MQHSISAEQWQNARKVLYMSHIAIGDYYYQRTYLAALREQYPHIQLDIWFDDCRSRPKAWHTGRNETLQQWLSTEPHINAIYPIASSKEERSAQIDKAKQQDYDIIVFMARVRSENYARIARLISSRAFIIGTKSQPLKNWFRKLVAFRHVDEFITLPKNETGHINQVYRNTFSQLFGDSVNLNVPVKALTVPEVSENQMKQWLIAHKAKQQSAENAAQTVKTVVINHLSTNQRRDLPWATVLNVIRNMHNANKALLFVINVPPAELEKITQQVATESALKSINIQVFTAQADFFQLPALLKLSQLVITVETAIMHLASGLHAPQVVLMRENAAHWCPVNVDKVLYGKTRVNEISESDITQAALDTLQD